MPLPPWHLRSAGAVALAAVVLSVGPRVASAQLQIQDSEYDCTSIASTDQFPEGFFGVATMNASGRVAFMARTKDFPVVFEIHTGIGTTSMGEPITLPIARSGPPTEDDAFFSSIESPVIDSQGRVQFHGQKQSTGGSPVLGLYRKTFDAPLAGSPEGRVLTPAGDPSSPFIAFRMNPTQDAGGRPLFLARRSADPGEGLFQGTAGNLRILSNSGGLQSVGEFAAHVGSQPFWAAIANVSGGNQELILNGTTLGSVSTSSGFLNGISLAGNVIGLVSYVETVSFVPNTWEIRVSTGLGTATYVNSDTDETDTTTRPVQTSVNSFHEVVFTASFGDPLLVADGNTLRRVVCRDSVAIFGVFNFPRHFISPRAVNNDGQIAFLAETGFIVSGTGVRETFVVRADPAQHARPSSCNGLPDDTPCDDGDPETIAFCRDAVCVPEPLPEPGPLHLTWAALAALALLARARGPASRRQALRAGAGRSLGSAC